MRMYSNSLICPNCKYPLKHMDKSFVCSNNHCFDVAKEGYVNLLLPNQKKSKQPGDDKLMINARHNFLEKGYYSTLRQELMDRLNQIKFKVLLDAGCGTGYYTKNINNEKLDVIGVDISKDAIQTASKSNKENTYVVASIFSLPIKDKSVDVVLSVFAPKPEIEFERVLKNDGVVVEVIPGKDHLKELKKVVYQDDFKENQEKQSFNNFKLLESKRITYKCNIAKEDIVELLKMTPYWYKGGEKYIERINSNKIEQITFDFILNIWGCKIAG